MLFYIPADHPSLAGHFPSHPIVPGVVLLDYIFATAKTTFPHLRACGIRKLKCVQPVLPEQTCEVQWAAVRVLSAEEAQVRFVCLRDGERVAEGHLMLEAV